MKSRLNYKSKRTIIIVAIIIVLLAIASTGIYMFTKGNDEARAFTEGNTTIGGSETNPGSEGNNPTENNGTVEEQPTIEPNVEPEQGSQNNNNQGTTTETQTPNTQGTTTSTTNSNVPNQEYVTERQEEVERLVSESFLVGWAPISVSAMTENIELNKANEDANYEVSKVATLVNGEAIRNENGEFKARVKPGDKVTYVITVRNTGNVTIQNIKVVDELVNYEETIPVLAIGDSKELEVTYEVKQEDITENDTIINTVKVSDKEEPIEGKEEIPSNPYVTVSGEKTWVAPEGTKYPTITINLLRDGEKIDSKELVNGKTTYSFENIYKYDEIDGHEYKYEVTENEVEGYTSKQEEYDFTNAIRTDLSYTVNYLEKGTNTVLNTAKTVDNQTFGTEITSADEVITIDGYKYDSVDKETLIIGTETNEINIYYTKRADLSYTVNYLEKDTNNVLSTAKTVGNQTFGAEVKEEAIEIEGYNKVAPTQETITIKVEGNVINFYYTKRADLNYTVNYLEKGTNKVLQQAKTENNQVFGTVITSANEVTTIDGYNYDSVDKETLIIGTGRNEINIYYTKRADLSYTVNYLEKGTNKVLQQAKTENNQVFGTVITSADEVITIDGYNYDSVDKETLTIGTETNEINIYYTKRADLSYTVNYLEKDTNNVLSTAKTVGNQTFGAEVKEEAIEIEGYNKVAPTQETITIKVEGNVINFYYTKRADLNYTVNYLEKGTNTVLQQAKTENNQVFGTEITSANEVITIDGYNYDSADKETLTIGTSENVINIYYTKRADLSYTVNYLEKGTNTVLQQAKTENNQVFGTEITSANEVITIDGYNYDSADKETLTIGTSTNEINIYYVSEKMDIEVIKVWDDDSNRDNNRLKNITIQLLVDGNETPIQTINLNKKIGEDDKGRDLWKGTFENVDKYSNGKSINYIVKELGEKDANNGSYKVAYDYSDYIEHNVVSITNSYTPAKVNGNGEIKVTKVWANDTESTRKNVTINLLANGKSTGKTLTLTANNNWTGKFTELPEKANGEKIKYSITENEVKDYATVITGDSAKGFTVTNTLQKAEISVEKTSQLYRNVKLVTEGPTMYGDTIRYTITAKNTGNKEGSIKVTDWVPEGTTLKEKGSTNLNADELNALTTKAGLTKTINVKANATTSIYFEVTVTAKANQTIKNIAKLEDGTDLPEKGEGHKVEKTINVAGGVASIKNSNVVLVLDVSGSMDEKITSTDPNVKTRLDAAKKASKELIDGMFKDGNTGSKVSVVTFSSTGFIINKDNAVTIGTANSTETANTLKTAIDGLNADGGTRIAAGLEVAQQQIESLNSQKAQKNIVIVLSDGDFTISSDNDTIASSAGETVSRITEKANKLKASSAKPTVYSIAFGTKNTSILKDIIASRASTYKTATDDLNDLIKIFNEVAIESGATSGVTSTNGLVELTNIDTTKDITITIKGNKTPITGKVSTMSPKVKQIEGKWYIDLAEFEADAEITVNYVKK